MQAQIYAPSVQQRREALKVAERFRVKPVLVKLGLYAVLAITYGWYRSDFTFPFIPNQVDLAVGIGGFLLGEIIGFFSKKDRAKWHSEDNDELAKLNGPLQYRLTETGLDTWWLGERVHRDWADFARFKLTDDLLILVPSRQRDEYWAIPRDGIGEALLFVVLYKLEEGGAKAAGR
jgi:hypothetical protein